MTSSRAKESYYLEKSVACDVITCKRKLLFRKECSVVTPSVAEFDILKNDIVIMLKVL